MNAEKLAKIVTVVGECFPEAPFTVRLNTAAEALHTLETWAEARKEDDA